MSSTSGGGGPWDLYYRGHCIHSMHCKEVQLSLHEKHKKG